MGAHSTTPQHWPLAPHRTGLRGLWSRLVKMLRDEAWLLRVG